MSFLLLVVLFFTNYSYAQTKDSESLNGAQVERSERDHLSASIETILYSPDYLFKTSGIPLELTPKNAASLGLRFSYNSISILLNSDRLFNNNQGSAEGLDFSTAFDSYFLNLYMMRASFYVLKSTDENRNIVQLFERPDLTSQVYGISLLKLHDSNLEYSTFKKPKKTESASKEAAETHLAYQLLVDRTSFRGDNPITNIETAIEKTRLVIVPEVGFVLHDANQFGYSLLNLMLGLGYLQEDRKLLDGRTENLKSMAYAISTTIDFVLHKKQEPTELDTGWYGGLSGGINLINSANSDLVTQRNMIARIFCGKNF